MKFVNPVTNEEEECYVFSSAGKKRGGNRTWFNVKNLTTGEKHSVDFAAVNWSKMQLETLYKVTSSEDVREAQENEFKRWLEYKVYEEVEDEGQPAIPVSYTHLTLPTNSLV